MLVGESARMEGSLKRVGAGRDSGNVLGCGSTWRGPGFTRAVDGLMEAVCAGRGVALRARLLPTWK